MADLSARGARVVAIGPGGQRAAELMKRALGLTYSVFGDPEGEAYAHFGFRRVLGLLQQSGTIVLDRSGIVCVANRVSNPASALPLDEVRAALGIPDSSALR